MYIIMYMMQKVKRIYKNFTKVFFNEKVTPKGVTNDIAEKQAKAQENSPSEAKKGVWGRVPINSQEESRSEQESGEPTRAGTCSHLHHR